MSPIALPTGSFNFPLDPTAAKGSIQIDAVPTPALLAALSSPQGVLPSQDTLIAGGALSVGTGHPIAVGPAQVGFSADADAALGIFTTPGPLRAALLKRGDLVSQVGDALSFVAPPGSGLLMLRWGYDLSANVSGAMALSPAVTFTPSVNAGRKGYYAIVQAAAPGSNAHQALGRLVGTWKLPSQVRDIAHLPPATWLIAEVDGSFGVKADLKFGYDFTWVREVAGLGLKGDIGLKLETGLAATFGFNTSGKYAIALSRESGDQSEQKIRMRLYKLRVNGWNFGFSGAATVKAVTPVPAQFQDLASAIIGTTGQQIVKLLGDVKDWTDPTKPLFGPFVNLADNEARALIQTIAGVSDLNATFASVKGAIQQVFHFWDNLPQSATRLIWSALPDSERIAKIAGIAQQVADLTPEALETLVKNSLADVPFLGSTQGQALESMAVNGLFAALNNSGALNDIRAAARQITQLLDRGALQNLLTNLENQVNTRLNLKQIESVVDQSSLASLDAWLKARLEDFLEQKIGGSDGVAAVQKLRAGLASVLAKHQELYDKALNVLQQNYDLSFNAAYQNAATTSALLDVTFDFGAPGSQAASALSLALGGNFDELLADPPPGVRIQEGVLAYGLHRESHVSLAFPFLSTTGAHINDTLAKLSRVEEAGGGLIYSLDASDLVTVKNDFSSALAIGLSVPGGRVRVHSTGSATYRYDLKTTAANVAPAALAAQYAEYAHAYFPAEFTSAPPGTFEEWVRQIAGASAALDAQVALNVTLPAQSLLVWVDAPANASDAKYKLMSIRLQRRFKRLLHDYFFDDVHHYANVSGDTTSKALLAFCSIPACSDAAARGDGLDFRDEHAAGKPIYWDYRDRDLRRRVLSDRATARNLSALLAAARARLTAAGDPDGVLSFYQDSQLGAILATARDGKLIDFLLPVEGNMVEQARAAGLKMASFRAHQFADPSQARKDLAQFGQKLTEDFNSNLEIFAVADALLPLGTLIYAEAVAALDSVSAAPASAMFTVQFGGRTERVVHVAGGGTGFNPST
jgi:hypothetical protein